MTEVVRDFAALFDGLPTAFLVVDRDLVVLDANRAYCRAVGRSRHDLVGRPVEAFPPAPAGPDSGDGPWAAALRRTRDLGTTETSPVVRCDVPDEDSGQVRPRFWSLTTAPLLAADGSTEYVVQRVEDVTDHVHEREGDRSRTRALEAARGVHPREVEPARAAERFAADRVSALGGAALRLAHAQHHEELIEVVAGLGLEAVGATRFEVAVLPLDDPGGPLDLWRVDSADGRLMTIRGVLPHEADSELLGAVRTGERVAQRDGLVVPLRAGDRLLGALAFRRPGARTSADVDADLVEAIAVQYGQALGRLRARETGLLVAADAISMSEALQRSLLTEPRQPDDVSVLARYRPAAQRAQIGGDWYDSFRSAGGRTTLVVGDVSGHDEESAAVMGQVRNLLRGIGYSSEAGPAAVLTTLDHALEDLDVAGLASAVLLTLTPGPLPGGATLRWTNAGAPPPLLRLPDGSVHLLQPPPELLLGVDPGTARTDHEVVLPAGAGVLLYTDGLVERRDCSVQDGLDWLTRTVSGMVHRTLEEIVDELLARVEGFAEDDVVLLGVQTGTPARIDLGDQLRSVAVL